jgi:alanine transaminase
MQADFFYCYRLLNETGIITVPGSAFGKVLKNNKIYFRLNNLLNPISRMEQVLNKIEKFNRNFHEKYQDDHPLEAINLKSQ